MPKSLTPRLAEATARAREMTGALVPAYHSGGTIYLRSSTVAGPLSATLLHELLHHLNWVDNQPEGEDNTATSTTTRIEDDFLTSEASTTNYKFDVNADACKCKR